MGRRPTVHRPPRRCRPVERLPMGSFMPGTPHRPRAAPGSRRDGLRHQRGDDRLALACRPRVAWPAGFMQVQALSNPPRGACQFRHRQHQRPVAGQLDIRAVEPQVFVRDLVEQRLLEAAQVLPDVAPPIVHGDRPGTPGSPRACPCGTSNRPSCRRPASYSAARTSSTFVPSKQSSASKVMITESGLPQWSRIASTTVLASRPRRTGVAHEAHPVADVAAQASAAPPSRRGGSVVDHHSTPVAT